MKQLRIVFSIFSILGVSFGICQNVKLEKSDSKVFSVQVGDRIEITNKYGEVIVNTHDVDSVIILVTLVAEGKSQEIVDKEMRRVSLSLRKVGQQILGITQIDQQTTRGTLGDMLGQVTDYSRTILAATKLKIDYEIWMPQHLDIRIENRFGDVYLETLTGEVKLDVSQGDIRANKITRSLTLKHHFGQHYFDFIGDGNLNLRGVESRIKEAGKLIIESGSSEFEFGKVDVLQVNSRNDKYSLNEVNQIGGMTSFSDISIERMTSRMEIQANYGEVYISDIVRVFDEIKIEGKSTDIRLVIDPASYIKTRITGNESTMTVPNSMLVTTKEKLSDARVSLNGFVGNTNTVFSNLQINAVGGELVISIKQANIYTTR